MRRWLIGGLVIVLGFGAAQGGAFEPVGLLENGTFDELAPWKVLYLEASAGESALKGGALCLDIENGGDASWNIQVLHDGLLLKAGHSYRFTFDAHSSERVPVRAVAGMAHEPWTNFADVSLELTPEVQSFDEEVTIPESDPKSRIGFFMGDMGELTEPLEVCFDNVTFSDLGSPSMRSESD